MCVQFLFFCLRIEENLHCRCSAAYFHTGVEKLAPIKVMEQEVVSKAEHDVSGFFFLSRFYRKDPKDRRDRLLVNLTAFHVSLNYMRLLYLSLQRRKTDALLALTRAFCLH